MDHITENDLKRKGIAAIDSVLNEHPEAIISVGGDARFVVLSLDRYRHLLAYELEIARDDGLSDIAASRFLDESASAHVARLLGEE